MVMKASFQTSSWFANNADGGSIYYKLWVVFQ